MFESCNEIALTLAFQNLTNQIRQRGATYFTFNLNKILITDYLTLWVQVVIRL